jgi:hypothetical protein
VISKLVAGALAALLLTVVVTAPLAASCADCAGSSCCCGKQGGCSKGPCSEQSRVRCCDGPEIAAPQGDASHVESPSAPMQPAAAAPFVETAAPTVDATRDVADPEPPSVGLFTLHAVLLI